MIGPRISVRGMLLAKPSLFDAFSLPDGVEKDHLIALILAECSELEVLFPDPDIFMAILSAWSAAHMDTWKRMLTALTAEYNPIENYDRKENWTDTASSQSSGDTTEQRAEFSQPGNFSNFGKNINTGSGSANSSHSGNVHGNIGVTTSQQMIEAEMELRKKYDIYNVILDEFASNFCILCY